MADSNLTLRSVKGSALTHQELDQNFKELFYSASISGSELYLYRSQSTNRFTAIQLPYPKGPEYALQFKLGTLDTGATVDFSGSKDLKFDYDNKIFTVTGSSYLGGNLTVDGTVIAKAFQSETIIETFSSGSTSFGNDLTDRHIRTGSLSVLGNTDLTGTLNVSGIITGSANFNTLINKPTLASGSSQVIISQTTGYTQFSSSIDTHLDSKVNTLNTSITNVSSSAHSQRIALYNNISSSAHNVYLKNTTDTLNGDLTVTGRISATEINTTYVSSSIAFSSGSNIFGDEPSDLHQFTGSVDINGVLTLPGVPNVSASLYTLSLLSGSSNVNITNNADNRILTATGTDSLNGESNLTFDGTALELTGNMTVTGDATINGTKITKFTSADADINTLIGGSTTGTLLEGLATGHVVIGLQEDSLGDSFAIIGGGGDYYSTTNYDKLIFKVSGSGQTYIGGALTVDGAITATDDITAYLSSDERLKDNITPIQGALGKINQIGGYEFDWNDNSEHSGHDVGVIAQEIEKVLPEVVTTRDNGYMAVRYEKIVALLIEAVKEQQLQIEELKSKL